MNLEENKKPYLLLSPALIIIISILGFGMINCILQSLGYFKAIGLEEITFKYYKEVLTSKDFLESFKFSMYISIVSSIIAVVIGVIMAYYILCNKKRNNFIISIYKIPIIIPHTVAALLVFTMLSQGGILSRILYHIGIIRSVEQFPLLVFDNKGIGIIITYVWKEVPFIAMVVYSIMSNINNKLFEAALNLGASTKKAFVHIMLPLAMPAIVSSFLIVVAFSFGAFEVPYLLGATSIKALPVKAYIEYSNADLSNRPYAMVINTILMIIAFILIFLYDKSYKALLKNK